ncbi:MAG: NrfD/PsrC family molybdoenzyme membrane anchor subunit [Bacillota bacterium]
MSNQGSYKLWLGATALLALLALGAWIYQLTNGLGVTGMNNVVSWGLYITLFMFFVGLSAGGLIVSSSATIFNIPAFKAIAKPGVILSTVSIILAALFIVVDVGSPARLYNLLLHPQLNSPLMWDVIVILIYLVINIIYLYLMTRPVPDEKKLKIVSRFAFPTAILVHSVTAWIFGLIIAREGWHSALMAPIFVASALTSGLALLIISLLLLNRYTQFKTDQKLITSCAGLLATCIAIDAFFVFSEVLTLFYPGRESTLHILSIMFSGSTAFLFWLEIILGIVLPFTILVFYRNREKTGLVAVSAILVIIGVFCKRAWLLLTSFLQLNISGSPGVMFGRHLPYVDSAVFPNSWVAQGSYLPTIVEIVIAVGLVSFGMFLFTVFARKMLLKQLITSKVAGQDQSLASEH